MNVPPEPASNYLLGGERVYTRDSGAPGWESLEEIVGGLEGGDAVAFASGMAAAAAVFDGMGAGARIALPGDCYHGVTHLVQDGQEKRGWVVEYIDIENTGGWIDACAGMDLVWLESVSNPLLSVADLKAIGAAPRRPGTILAVDNTFATPLNLRPLEFGADVSMHSATKFIGGHSDLLAGLLVTRSADLLGRIRSARTFSGAAPGALEAFLAVRGLRTLALRLERAQETAGRLASWLAAHPCVDVVRYPGLESHPTHDLAATLLDGFGTMISFDVKGGAAAADAVCGQLRLVRHATSLGSVESTIERRAAIPGQEHLPDSLLRLSVGAEAGEDLRADLDQAMKDACG
jgi:cystathionine gamma-synthase